MVETGDAHLTYSLKHKKHGGEGGWVNSCIQRATAEGRTQTGLYEAGTGWANIQWEGKVGEVSREGCPEGYSSSEESRSKL